MDLLLIILALGVLALIFFAGVAAGMWLRQPPPAEQAQRIGQRTMADIDGIVDHYVELQQIIADLVDGQH